MLEAQYYVLLNIRGWGGRGGGMLCLIEFYYINLLENPPIQSLTGSFSLFSLFRISKCILIQTVH